MTVSVLITGGIGFVGSAILDAVRGKHPEWTFSVFDLHGPNERHPDVSYIFGDITDSTEVDRVIAHLNPTVIIHTAGIVPSLAGRYSRNIKDDVFRVNVKGTQNIINAAKRRDIHAAVWTGSFTAVTDDMRFQYPNIDERWPTSSQSLVYGESKVSFISHYP